MFPANGAGAAAKRIFASLSGATTFPKQDAPPPPEERRVRMSSASPRPAVTQTGRDAILVPRLPSPKRLKY
jgi:hypothetical protein